MSDNSESTPPYDPLSMMKEVRDENMQRWAKMMTDLVNTDAYSAASAEMLKETLETSMTQAFKNMNLVTGDDFMRLADRLTNIEMRLDDMEAKLDESLRKKSTKKG